jgi:hypothetical protein
MCAAYLSAISHDHLNLSAQGLNGYDILGPMSEFGILISSPLNIRNPATGGGGNIPVARCVILGHLFNGLAMWQGNFLPLGLYTSVSKVYAEVFSTLLATLS